jgi:molybdopterin adenylyltransferase
MGIIQVAILTISDRSYVGERPDLSGPALLLETQEQGWSLVDLKIVPDDYQMIVNVLVDWSNSGKVDVILTTGVTGISSRDITPEATMSVVQKVIPGFSEAMRSEGMKTTPHAMLSRAVVGIRANTIIVNLPGNPKGAVENLRVVLPAIPHAVQILKNDSQSEIGHHFEARK